MSIESTKPYDTLPSDDELVERYKPKFLARGGDHLVYEVVDHPDVVIKASTFRIKDILSSNSDNSLQLDSFSGDLKMVIEKETAEKNVQIRELRKYFGNEHTLSERRYIMKVPVTKELLDEIFKNDWKGRIPPQNVKDIKEAWSTVIVQERADAIDDTNHLGLYFGGFLEDREYDVEEYKKLNESLIKQNTQSGEDVERFLELQDNPQTHALRDILNLVEKDKSLKTILTELVEKIVSYARETGNILALAGKDNIIFYHKDGEWNYLLVDALPIHNEPVYKEAQIILHKFANDEEITKYDKTLLMKALNFTRTINGLCASLGIKDRLRLISDEDLEKNIDIALAVK
jgi:hypothetical protein